MKKLSTCILTFLMLLLLFSLCTSQFTELSFGKPGNTVGNIKNGGTAAEDEKYIYYAAYDGGLYKENKVDGAVKKIGGSIHGVGYLNVMGNNKKGSLREIFRSFLLMKNTFII